MRWITALVWALLALACDAPVQLDAGSAPDGGSLDAGATSDSGSMDAGPLDAGREPPDAGGGDAGSDAGPPEPPTPAPNSIFFIGNSFTFGGPVPTLVHDLAVFAGHPEPLVEYRAVPGRPLSFHRADTDSDGAPARVMEGWDVLVLQEQSTRPTDSLGNPDRFKDDATWFYDLAKSVNPECEVVLYETWARREGHSYYDSSFVDPADMQGQLSFHYHDAAERWIPTMSGALSPDDVQVAHVGDAWQYRLDMGEPPRLHASDDWHAGSAGQYLNALVIYATIYERSTRGLLPLRGLDSADAELLQIAADAITGYTRPIPRIEDPLEIEVGDAVRVDVGPDEVADWEALASANASAGPLTTVGGDATLVTLSASGFNGVQSGGSSANAFGWPGDVSADSLWVGTFDGHDEALLREARVSVRGLPPGSYSLSLFASRDGTDSGRGRLTRYAVGGEFRDLEVADNTSETATFVGVRPSPDGDVEISIAVSPDGSARFAYLGAVVITRSGD